MRQQAGQLRLARPTGASCTTLWRARNSSASNRRMASKRAAQVVAGEQEGRGLAGGQEAAVARALHAAELGEAALRVLVARPQHVEQLRPHVRDQREQDHQAHAAGQRGARGRSRAYGDVALERRRRQVEVVILTRVPRSKYALRRASSTVANHSSSRSRSRAFAIRASASP